ncbi:MAG: 16S rRNA (cytosine(1402)-N(4))-methyltransferase RsmH, partial [Planctomycetales bacterium]|nr:16S rRNA (cytosine(1402)-N(4))-methyltransferase RsmH [Planctomycetales bacterium]
AAREWLPQPPCAIYQASFRDLPEVFAELELAPVDGVLLDLGLSSDQLADAERGFSFQSDGELDLRFDVTEGDPAWRLLQRLSEKHLADLIYAYGEERFSRRIARKLVARREDRRPVMTSADLASLVQSCIPAQSRQNSSIHPATRTFQALRIAVNDELGALESVLKRLPDVLKPGGRAALISFHSLEDRRVKQAFRDDPRYHTLTRKPITPNEAEIERNPRSRSARLRVAERTRD